MARFLFQNYLPKSVLPESPRFAWRHPNGYPVFTESSESDRPSFIWFWKCLLPVEIQAEIPPIRRITQRRRRSDKVFRGVVTSGGLASFVILGLIGGFLLYRGYEIFKDFGFSFITSSQWTAASEDGLIKASFGLAAMLVGSLVTATVALAIATPFVIGVSLFLEYYAPKPLRAVLVSVLDLVSAIPSVIYGIWGYIVLMPYAAEWGRSINKYLGWIPLFDVPAPIFDRSPFTSGLVLALMVVPIATSVTREVYSRAPREQFDAALALGGSRWGAIRAVVLPFGKSGLVGGSMLGLGRAIGETVAVYLTLNLVFKVNFQILASAGGSIASLIAGHFGEAGPQELKALMAAGLVLFIVTLFINTMASAVVMRSTKDKS